MKKFAILLFVLLPLLNSCSGDSDGENSNGLLVKKITSTSGGGSVYTTNFPIMVQNWTTLQLPIVSSNIPIQEI